MRRSMYACGVLFALLGVGMMALALALGAGSEGTTTLLPVGAIFLPCAALFFWVGSWGVMGNGPLADPAELNRFGRPASASVLEVESPQLSAGGGGGARVRLEVSPRNESSFKAWATLDADRPTPFPGETLSVKFDPNKRKSLIVVDAPLPSSRTPIVVSPWGRA